MNAYALTTKVSLKGRSFIFKLRKLEQCSPSPHQQQTTPLTPRWYLDVSKEHSTEEDCVPVTSRPGVLVALHWVVTVGGDRLPLERDSTHSSEQTVQSQVISFLGVHILGHATTVQEAWYR